MGLISKIGLSSIWERDDDFTVAIKHLIGFKPKNIQYFKTAFTHKSEIKKAEDGSIINYERLEFLGDSLLDASITIFLYENLPDGNEGELTQMRAKIVSRGHLNEVGRDLELIGLAKKPDSKRKFSYNANGDLFEALVAAIYLDRGFEVMHKFVKRRLIGPYVDLEKLQGKIASYKSLMIEWCQKHHYDYRFEVFEDTGKDHNKHFGVKLYVNEEVVSKGRSTSKKKAEEVACRRAYYSFQEEVEADFAEN